MKAIQDIRIDRISIDKTSEQGETFTGQYSLISPSGATLAKQSFNGYNDVKVEMSDETKKIAIDFMASFKNDLNKLLFGGE